MPAFRMADARSTPLSRGLSRRVRCQVGLGGGPFPLLRVLDPAGAGRILLDRQRGGPETFFVRGRAGRRGVLGGGSALGR
jgi:hypothetical protein